MTTTSKGGDGLCAELRAKAAQSTRYRTIHRSPARTGDHVCSRAAAHIEALEAESAALTKALTGLTCSGSEFFIRKGNRFVADIDACVAYVRRCKEDAHRRAVNAIRDRQAAEAKAASLTALLEEAKEIIREIAATSVLGPEQAAHYNAHRKCIRLARTLSDKIGKALAGEEDGGG